VPANRNGRSKQPIIEAANQTLALLAVFVYATHATQSIALRALRLDGNRALVTNWHWRMTDMKNVPKFAVFNMGGLVLHSADRELSVIMRCWWFYAHKLTKRLHI